MGSLGNIGTSPPVLSNNASHSLRSVGSLWYVTRGAKKIEEALNRGDHQAAIVEASIVVGQAEKDVVLHKVPDYMKAMVFSVPPKYLKLALANLPDNVSTALRSYDPQERNNAQKIVTTFLGIMRNEGFWDPSATRGNAIGLCQVELGSANDVGDKNGWAPITRDQLFNPGTNIKYGFAVFNWILKNRANGDIDLAVVLYKKGAYYKGAPDNGARIYLANVKDFVENFSGATGGSMPLEFQGSAVVSNEHTFSLPPLPVE